MRVVSRRVKSSGATPAVQALEKHGAPFEVVPYEHDPAVTDYGREACLALGVDPRQVFKTLVLQVDSVGYGVCVIPVEHQGDLKAVAAALGGKRARLAEPDAVRRLTGYVLGGVSPLGQRTALPTVVDVTALDHERIFVSGGRRGLEVAMAPADLIDVTGAVVSAVAR